MALPGARDVQAGPPPPLTEEELPCAPAACSLPGVKNSAALLVVGKASSPRNPTGPDHRTVPWRCGSARRLGGARLDEVVGGAAEPGELTTFRTGATAADMVQRGELAGANMERLGVADGDGGPTSRCAGCWRPDAERMVQRPKG